MFAFLTLFILGTSFTNCFPNYKIHSVNKNEGRSEISIGVIKNGSNYKFVLHKHKLRSNVIASATFLDQINSTGWSHLSVTTYADFKDEIQAYYAGVVEGISTRTLIAAHLSNTFPNYCVPLTDFCKRLQEYLSTNIDFMVKASRGKGGYWKMIRLHLWQIKGLQDGFDNNVNTDMDDLNENYLLQLKHQIFKLYLLQLDGDLSALSAILGGSNYHATFPGHKIIGDGSCSAFIKYIKGDIYTSHVTWNGYSSMLRMTKVYTFPYRYSYNESSSSKIPAETLSFSSYPGQTCSLDDFYISSTGLVTTETTIGNYNKTLWESLKNSSKSIVFEFFRVQLANRLATSSPQWTDLFSRLNSGTYNNQWMIVDYKLLKDHQYGMSLPNDVLWIAEQIPLYVVAWDATENLRTSYWASYNIPQNKFIWEISGFGEMAAKYGDFFTIDKGPRALIFKRDYSNVTDLHSLMRLMRYNDFKNDPLAKCSCKPPFSAENGISARCDLNEKNGSYPFGALSYRLHGGTDVKIANLQMVKAMKFVAQSGPTFDQQPFFNWKNINDPSVNHHMHPDLWNFEPVITPFPENNKK